MDKFGQANFYVVLQDLSVIECDSLEDCITYEDFFYAIKEVAGGNEAFNIELLNASGDEFMIEENGWKVTATKAEPSQKGTETIQSYINMMITDSQGNVEVITANRENYKGVVQLHQSLRYLSLSSDWITANKRKFHVELKKLFTRLKNGRFIQDTIYLNPDEDYSIDLSFENGQFVMRSYIETGDFLMEGKNEEIYTNVDFYQFIKFVLNKFPAIDLTDC